eukprot:g19088.t1
MTMRRRLRWPHPHLRRPPKMKRMASWQGRQTGRRRPPIQAGSWMPTFGQLQPTPRRGGSSMFQLYDCRAIRLISCEAEAKAMTAVSPFDVADSMLGAAFGAPIHATGAKRRRRRRRDTSQESDTTSAAKGVRRSNVQESPVRPPSAWPGGWPPIPVSYQMTSHSSYLAMAPRQHSLHPFAPAHTMHAVHAMPIEVAPQVVQTERRPSLLPSVQDEEALQYDETIAEAEGRGESELADGVLKTAANPEEVDEKSGEDDSGAESEKPEQVADADSSLPPAASVPEADEDTGESGGPGAKSDEPEQVQSGPKEAGPESLAERSNPEKSDWEADGDLQLGLRAALGLPDPSEEPEVIEVGSSTLQRSNPGSCVLFLQSDTKRLATDGKLARRKRALAAQAAEGSRRCQLGVREDGSSPGGFVARDLVEESRASPPPAATPRPPATPAAPVLLVRRLSGTPGAGAGASPGDSVAGDPEMYTEVVASVAPVSVAVAPQKVDEAKPRRGIRLAGEYRPPPRLRLPRDAQPWNAANYRGTELAARANARREAVQQAGPDYTTKLVGLMRNLENHTSEPLSVFSPTLVTGVGGG